MRWTSAGQSARTARLVRAEPQGGNIVGEGVQPHIEDVAARPREGDAPGDGRPADGEVLEPALHEGAHLVHPALGKDEAGPVGVELQEGLLVLGEPEEVGFLLQVRHGVAEVGALAVDDLVLGEEGLAGDAVGTRVGGLVDVPRRLQPLQEGQDAPLVALLGGADEVVVGDQQGLPQRVVARTTRSARAFGAMPSAAAVFWTFWPCSSVPVARTTRMRWSRRCCCRR